MILNVHQLNKERAIIIEQGVCLSLLRPIFGSRFLKLGGLFSGHDYTLNFIFRDVDYKKDLHFKMFNKSIELYHYTVS